VAASRTISLYNKCPGSVRAPRKSHPCCIALINSLGNVGGLVGASIFDALGDDVMLADVISFEIKATWDVPKDLATVNLASFVQAKLGHHRSRHRHTRRPVAKHRFPV